MNDIAPEQHPDVLRVYIGFDPRQIASYTAAAMSLVATSSKPVAITPLVIETLPIENTGLTPFTFSRFLVPWLAKWAGWALFVDADVVFRSDVAELFDLARQQPDKAILVPDLPEEYRFEQASVMLFNCAHMDHRRHLMPSMVAKRQTTLIDWTEHVGTFGPEWNHLVGYLPPNPDANLVHYTQGVPFFPQTNGCEHTESWLRAFVLANSPMQIPQIEISGDVWQSLMGHSVHAKTLPDGRVVPKLTPEPVPPAPAAEVAPVEKKGGDFNRFFSE